MASRDYQLPERPERPERPDVDKLRERLAAAREREARIRAGREGKN